MGKVVGGGSMGLKSVSKHLQCIPRCNLMWYFESANGCWVIFRIVRLCL